MQLRGSICALVTPFSSAGDLDLEAFERLLDWHASAGTQAVVIGGSTGESGALETTEVVRLVRQARQKSRAQLQIWAGIGAPATHKALHLGEALIDAGAQVLLAVTPYYSRPPQEGLYRHYQQLADQLAAPLVLYNVPGRTGVDLLPETVARLIDHPNIIGIKEAVGRDDRLQAMLALRRPDFAILSGDDGTCAEWMVQGADGVVSVAANVVPELMAHLATLAQDDPQGCRALDLRLRALYVALESAPNPMPVKALLARLGHCGPTLRLPLIELEPSHEAHLLTVHEQLHA
ncbi:MAG: 4-hydroxy-tetrahydrodipicolinate synthase [Gammaproteobacteria bacterium]|nr:4-hydroxy-tetrahydrodipicolinate synthase [Gammaproteobacteria bacterium]